MAVTARAISSSLQILVESDVASDGSAVYSTRTISRIDPAATDENAYDVATAIGTLQDYPVGDITRTTKTVLTRA